MKGIRTNLLQAFLAVIVGLSFCIAALLVLNDYVVRQYKSLSDTVIAEYRLVDALSGLIDAYNTRVISTDTNVSAADAELKKTQDQVAQLKTFLDTAITDKPSQVSYVGLTNSIDAVTATIDGSLQKVSRGDIESFTADYYQANREYQFVRDNGTTLIFSELQYASSILDAINRTYLWSKILGGVTLLLIILACVIYVTGFSKRLTSPILRLQQLALQIAEGKLDIAIEQDMLAREDELGSLTQSFQNMTSELAKAKERVVQSQQQLKERADDLERMNKLMIGRELKMVEMKKELEKRKA